jgi:SH3 domain
MLSRTGLIRTLPTSMGFILLTCYDRSSLSPVDINRGSGLTHIFLRATDDTKSDIAHSKKSARSSRSNMADSSDSSGDESTETANRTGGNERRSRTGSGPSSRPPSRPTSGASRKRTNSAGCTEKEKSDKAGRRMSMAGWASSAVSSVTGRAKKDKDKFTTLTDDDQSDHDDGDLKRSSSRTSYTNQHLRSKSKDSPANASPKIPIRIFKPLQGKKLVRALYDFTGSTDELAFNAGDEIVVLNEVLDEWWMGELNGQKGLFPTSYTEVIPTSPSKPFAAYRQRIEISPSSTDSPSTQSPLYMDGYITSGLSDSHLFGDPQVVASRSPLWGNFDAESITDSAAEEDEEKRLMPVEQPSGDDDYDRHVRKRSASQPSRPSMLTGRSVPNLITTPASPAKKIPPPPPPRRSASNILAPPPIPQRKQSVFGSRSSGSLCSSSPRSSSVSSLDHGVSPFESATEISMIGCQNFRQNPFKPPGMCSNCSQVHM